MGATETRGIMRDYITDTPLHRMQGVLPSTMRLAVSSRNEKVEVRMSRSVRTLASTCSRVPHGTGATRFHPLEETIRQACAPRRDSTLALPLLLVQHRSIFTPGPSPGNPPKRSSVVKVLSLC